MSLGPVLGAPVDARLSATAAELPDRLRVGTSSWSFPGWDGLVWEGSYDKTTLAREGLSAYARHPLLRTVGVDRTYYAPLPAAAFASMAEQVPDGFRFLVKAHEALLIGRFPRHKRYGADAGQDNPRFLDVEHAAEAVVQPAIDGLGDKLGVLLFQFPPQSPRAGGGPEGFGDTLGRFLAALPELPPTARYAVEIRTPQWLTPGYAEALTAHGACHSYVVHPKMPDIREQMRRVPGGARHGLVVRWMLQPGLDYAGAKARFEPFAHRAAPDEGHLAQIAHLVSLALQRELDVTVIINNKAEGSAPRSAFALQTEVARRLGAGPSTP